MLEFISMQGKDKAGRLPELRHGIFLRKTEEECFKML